MHEDGDLVRPPGASKARTGAKRVTAVFLTQEVLAMALLLPGDTRGLWVVQVGRRVWGCVGPAIVQASWGLDG